MCSHNMLHCNDGLPHTMGKVMCVFVAGGNVRGAACRNVAQQSGA